MRKDKGNYHLRRISLKKDIAFNSFPVCDGNRILSIRAVTEIWCKLLLKQNQLEQVWDPYYYANKITQSIENDRYAFTS